MSRNLRLPLPGVVVLVLAMVMGLWTAPPALAQQPVQHPVVVPEVPRADFPQILDGEVLDMDANEEYVVAAGNFTQVQDKDGTILQQPSLVAFDIDTGDLITSFRPVIDGPVNSVTLAPDTHSVFVGGKFTTISGTARKNVARVSLLDGSVDESWRADTDGIVKEIAVLNDQRMFIGGVFTRVRGQAIHRLAELELPTGKPNTAFSFTFDGTAGTRGAGQNIRYIGLTPAGNRMVVVHSADTVNGERHRGAAIFDISDPANPRLTPFSVNNYDEGARHLNFAPAEGSLSPDGSFFVMVSTGNVYAFPVVDTPEPARLWMKDHQDSVYALAVSNNAVYTGGHFCKIASGPGPTDLDGSGRYTDKTCSGTTASYPQNGAYRWQIAALNPIDSTPLAWDPGTDVYRGVLDLKVTARGLLVGGDGNWLGGVRTGRAGFFDLGSATVDKQAPSVASTTATSQAGPQITLQGTARDDIRLNQVQLRVRDAGGRYLQADGTFAFTATALRADLGLTRPGVDVGWTLQTTLADGTYTVEASALDYAGRRSSWVSTAVSVGGGGGVVGQCSITTAANGDATLNWNDEGASSYSVRRDGSYLTSVATTSYTDTDTAGLAHAYTVRYRSAGTTVELDCGTSLGANTGGGDAVCTATLDGSGNPLLTWTSTGATSYSVRRDGKYLTSVSETSYTDTAAPVGAHAYVVRYRQSGVNTDLSCGTVTVTDQTPPDANVALRRPATQSSTYPGGDASKAVDGSAETTWAAGSVAHTLSQDQPWWEVDLGTTRTINSIELLNRTDCCSDRLNDSVLLISDTPMTGRTLTDLLSDPSITAIDVPGVGVSATFPADGATGRYVRVQRRVTGFLGVAEVIVNGH
ncbi:MAG: discoidin domain-containing protein [Actinomycetales bacterium]